MEDLKVGDGVKKTAECWVPKGAIGRIVAVAKDSIDVAFEPFKNGNTEEIDINRVITCNRYELEAAGEDLSKHREFKPTDPLTGKPLEEKKEAKVKFSNGSEVTFNREESADITTAHVSPTGSLRLNNGKPEVSHIAPEFILDLASLMSASAKKYSKWNYAKGQYLTTPADSLMRHFIAFMAGENNDPESNHSHLVHIAANALIMWCTTQYHLDKHPELDDRFKKVLGIKEDKND